MASPESKDGILDIVYPNVELTSRERQVFTLSSGWDGIDRSKRQVSRETGLSTRTVGNIEKRVLQKVAGSSQRSPR